MPTPIRYEEEARRNGTVRRVPIIMCRCGREVACDGFTNTCECGADYNWNGALLASRSQWGCETGESVADILSVDSTPPGELLEGDW